MKQYLMKTPPQNSSSGASKPADTTNQIAQSIPAERGKAELARLKRDYHARSACDRPLPRSVDLAYRRTIATQESKLSD